MQKIDSEAELEAIYGAANPKAIEKVATAMTPLYARWIQASRFLVLASVGPEGTDLSPRGEDGPVVHIQDHNTLLLPDWMGNNRIDSLRNIVRDERVSVMFMVPGSDNVVRANGSAIVTTDTSLLTSFAKNGKQPRSVIVITITEIYFQCAKALMRSRLWSPEAQLDRTVLPSMGQMIKDQTKAREPPEGQAEMEARYEKVLY